MLGFQRDDSADDSTDSLDGESDGIDQSLSRQKMKDLRPINSRRTTCCGCRAEVGATICGGCRNSSRWISCHACQDLRSLKKKYKQEEAASCFGGFRVMSVAGPSDLRDPGHGRINAPLDLQTLLQLWPVN